MTDADKPAFAQAMARLGIALREKDLDAVQVRTYFQRLDDLDVELVVAAAERLAESATWFPKAPEWRAAVATIERERLEELAERIRKRRLAGEPSLCAACDDTGFKPVEVNRFAPCDCRTLRRLEVLGRRPMPALPESVPTHDNLPAVLPLAQSAVKGMP